MELIEHPNTMGWKVHEIASNLHDPEFALL